jgi:Mg2+ and Co2+ transporter CorA
MSHLQSPEVDYGSDRSGLVWGYLFTPGEAPQQIECTAALEWLKSSARSEFAGFVWLHFSLSNAGTERWMRDSLSLTDSFYDSLHENIGSTRLELEDDKLVAVIHDVIFNTTFDASNISTVTLSMERRLVISARLRPLRSVDRLRAAVKAGEMLRSAPELLAELLRAQRNEFAATFIGAHSEVVGAGAGGAVSPAQPAAGMAERRRSGGLAPGGRGTRGGGRRFAGACGTRCWPYPSTSSPGFWG